jgi:DnaJ-class molecular chaperone
MPNPYDVLGVTAKASAADIKKAYRRLAKKLHPDANKNDPKTAAKFSEINSAYEIVGDEDKRKAFDRGEIDAEGKPRFQGFEGFGGGHPGARGPGQGTHFETFTWGPGGARRSGGARGGGGSFSGFEDILSSVFGGRGGARPDFGASFETDDLTAAAGRDVAGTVTISLEDVARGAKARVQLPTGKDVEVKIPAGLNDGQQIRLKGQGMPGAGGGPVGDALITVRIAPHPHFKIDGANLRVEVPITLYEAVLGGKVRVPTLEGPVDLAIPANTNAGRTFRLKGKGLPAKSGKGDLFATVRIMLPKEPDEELEKLMREWREKKPYSPRSGLE